MRLPVDDPRYDELARQIAWAAEARPGADLLFVVANTHQGRTGFADALGAATNTVVLDLAEADPKTRFLTLLRDLPKTHTVLVTGLEPHARAAGTRGSLFGGLNLDRDAIRREDRNLVFLLPSFALDALAQNAPDFYDFRTVALEMSDEQSWDPLSALRDDSYVLALNPRDRERWIEILRSQPISSDSDEEIERGLRLARLLREQGKFKNSRDVLETLLHEATEKSVLSLRIPTILNDLGGILHELGDLDGSFDAFNEAASLGRASRGSDHPELAIYINNVGNIQHDRGDFDGALAAFREAERIHREAYGDDHPRVATNISNVGSVLHAQGDLDGALAAFREAERIDRDALGDDHPSTAVRMNNIGSVLRDKGELDGALAAYREAERIHREAYGDEHPNVAIMIGNVASALLAQGDLEGALKLFREAERIDRNVFGDGHPSVAFDIHSIGGVLYTQGDVKEALSAASMAYLIFFNVYGPHGRGTAALAHNVVRAGGDPISLVRKRFGDDAARELVEALQIASVVP